MKGDFTRRTFDRRNHFRTVLMQQGRVQLDADWNEQAEIQQHLDRTTTVDTVGSHGGPLPGAGFAVTAPDGSAPDGTAAADLLISAGRYYVDGVLCENEEPVAPAAQPDLPGVELPDTDGRYVAYLDVWCEHVTALERPQLREVALGGPDTATRGRTVWQLRLAPVAATASCADVAPPWAPDGSASTGRLRARAQAPVADPNPCVIPATAGYRRLENQLYRVEIHDDSDSSGGPTYVWSRENGSVVARAVEVGAETIRIDAPGRDERLGFAKNDWVEVVDVDRVRRGEPGFLALLDDAAGAELTVDQWRGAPPSPADLGEVVLVRRWDSAGAVGVAAGWVALEDGVEIEFEPGGVFRTGDHWLIPARTANLQGGQVDPDLAGDVEWPRVAGVAQFRPRAGTEHRFAAVGLLDRSGDAWTRVSDCRRLFPPLTGLTDVEYAGGDGQEAMPGEPLPQPLQVSVSNGTAPVTGARVRFAAADADGRLAITAADLDTSTQSAVVATTDADGIARCFWQPAADVTRPSQPLLARLLAPGDVETGAPVDFAARLSIAGQVWFDPGGCAALQDVGTVQDALATLVAARSLLAVGGDGQDGEPGADLPFPVELLVRSDCGPVPDARVSCTVDSGAVGGDPADLGAGATTVELATGADGVARCFWRLGDGEPVQLLTARLQPDDGTPVGQPDTVAFTANLRTRDGHRPGMHVRDVIVLNGNAPLRNDSFATPDDLVEGFAVVLDGEPLAVMVDRKPVLTLTLELPYPFLPGEMELWGGEVVGTRPLTLAGTVAARGEAVLWSPTPASRALLTERLFELMEEFRLGDRVLCHVTLTGRAVADSAEPDRRVVNGLALGLPGAGGTTDLELPSVDDVLGADFTLWFWLVRTIVDLIVLPTRAGVLRLKTARDALTLSSPRTELLDHLPGGVRVTAAEPDLDGARRAADRAFRDRPERRLVLVVDERFADAAAAVRDALGALDVALELVPAAEPVVAARERAASGEPFDGVLTSDEVAGQITDLGGFGDAIRL